MAQTLARQASEDVIINAPMSFAGAAQRSFRLRRKGSSTPALILLTIVALILTALWWLLVLVWYIVFGIALLPYRILRRGARKRKAEALRHREMMSVIEQSKN